MKKASILFAIVGVGIVYMFWKKKQAIAPSVPTSNPSNYSPAQPSLLYPWSPIVPPRVDNANQPWYNGPTSFQAVNTKDSNAMTQAATAIGAGGSIIHSLTDVWGDLSDTFGNWDDDSKYTLTNTDDLPTIGDTQPTESMEGSGEWAYSAFDESYDGESWEDEYDFSLA